MHACSVIELLIMFQVKPDALCIPESVNNLIHSKEKKSSSCDVKMEPTESDSGASSSTPTAVTFRNQNANVEK